jgi:hypothetical protein
MFYTPSENPPSHYGNYVVAILEPPLPIAEEGVWSDLLGNIFKIIIIG